nr:MFS transporter [Halogranum amylolyticum]
MITQLRGALLPNFQQTFAVSEQLLGFVAPAGTLGLVATVLVVGMLSGRLDLRRMILAGTGATAVCLLLVSITPSYGFLLVVFLLQGGTVGVVRALDRPLLGHLFPERRGQLFNLYALMWALGATTGPLLANAILAIGDWRLAYLLLTGVFFAVAFVVTRLDRPSVVQAEKSLSWADLRGVLRLPSVRGMAAALVVSGAIEGTVFTWLPYYASQFFAQSTANLLLSGFLVMYVPGRLAYGFLADRLRPLNLVLSLAVVGLPMAAIAFVSGSTLGLVSGTLGLGLLVAGFFPTLSAFGVGSAPEYSGPVNAIATAANFTGLSAAPVVVGIVADRYDIATGMQLLLPALGCLVVVVVVTRIHLGRLDRSIVRA